MPTFRLKHGWDAEGGVFHEELLADRHPKDELIPGSKPEIAKKTTYQAGLVENLSIV